MLELAKEKKEVLSFSFFFFSLFYSVIFQFTVHCPFFPKKAKEYLVNALNRLKNVYAESPEKQIAVWKHRFSQLKGGLDAKAYNLALQGKTNHSFLCVLPKTSIIFGKDQPSIYKELKFLQILADSCKESGKNIQFHNEIEGRSGKELLIQGELYWDFEEMTAKQEGDFVVFNMDLGREIPYREGPMRIDRKKLPLPLGLMAGALSVQNIATLWLYDLNMWTASLATGIKIGNGSENGKFGLPCFEFEPNFGGSDILRLCPLEILLYYNNERSTYGGFSTALRLE